MLCSQLTGCQAPLSPWKTLLPSGIKAYAVRRPSLQISRQHLHTLPARGCRSSLKWHLQALQRSRRHPLPLGATPPLASGALPPDNGRFLSRMGCCKDKAEAEGPHQVQRHRDEVVAASLAQARSHGQERSSLPSPSESPAQPTQLPPHPEAEDRQQPRSTKAPRQLSPPLTLHNRLASSGEGGARAKAPERAR